MVAASTVVHAVVGLQRPTPLLYPDEYLYTAMARSIASSGLPRVRGQIPHFPAVLGPYLVSPAWFVHNVDIAYRIALSWGSLWFSLAAIPAYAIARKVGVSSSGALLAALLALLVPDAVYTTNLLSEPFAYPAFLTCVLVAMETIARPTGRRQLLLLVLFVALCLLRFELVVFPAAYFFTSLACSGWSPRTLLRRQTVLVAGVGLGVLASLIVGLHRLVGYYSGSLSRYHFQLGPLRWFALDLFVLLIAAGWVVVPGACVGFAQLLRGDPRQRGFAVLALTLTLVLLAVAAPYGPSEGRVYERYFFYVAPLIGIGFVWSVESLERSRIYAAVAYAVGVAGLMLPIVSGVRDAYDDMSPTLLGLRTIGGSSNASTLVWATALAVAAAFTGLRIGRRMAAPLVAVAILAAVGAMGTESLLGFGTALGKRLNMSPDVPRLHAPSGAALVTSEVTNRWLLMKTLFWNPSIERVLVLGKGPATDGFPATNVQLEPGRGLVDAQGRPIPGPFVVDTDTVAANATGDPNGMKADVFRQAPTLFVFGWNRVDDYLAPVSWLYATAGSHPIELRTAMTSQRGRKTMAFDCGRWKRRLVVSSGVTAFHIRVRPRNRLDCRISLIKGSAVTYRDRTVSVQARLGVRVLSAKR